MNKSVGLSLIKLNMGLLIRNWTLSIFIFIGFIFMMLCAIGLLKFPHLSDLFLYIITSIMIALIMSGFFLKNRRIIGTIEFTFDRIIISIDNMINIINIDNIKLLKINYKGHKNSDQIPYFANLDGVSRIKIKDLSGDTYKFNFFVENNWQEIELQEIIKKWELQDLKIRGKDRFHYKFY